MAKILQDLLITFVFLSYSLLIKMLFTVSRSHLTSPFVPLIFCLLAKAKLHNNCCSLFKLSCTTYTTCSCNVNNFPVLSNSTDLFFRFYSLLQLTSLESLFHAVPGPAYLVLFYSAPLPHHRPNPHTHHLSTLSPFHMSQRPATFPSLTSNT